MKKQLMIVSMALFGGTMTYAQNLGNHRDSISYAMGVSMAETMKKSGITDYDEAIFMRAIKESFAGKSSMPLQSAEALYRAETKKISDQKSATALKEGEEFCKKNSSQPGVVTTASGLQYKHEIVGTGDSPDANDKVTVHYHGTLTDGTVFDSSVDRGQPATFGLNQVIPGWTEGLQYMKTGGKTRFFIPANLAYGQRSQGKIPGNSLLIFDVELISMEKIEGTTPPAQGQPLSSPNTAKPAGKPADAKPAAKPADVKPAAKPAEAKPATAPTKEKK